MLGLELRKVELEFAKLVLLDCEQPLLRRVTDLGNLEIHFNVSIGLCDGLLEKIDIELLIAQVL